MKIYVDPAKEAEQIFHEGWRFQRDFLYVDNVHGAPWDKVYSWYKPWVAHVKHRSDLNYILEYIGGEVSIGHSFVGGGDFPEVKSVPVGLLGADYTADNGYFKIRKIYTGENWNPDLRSPLSGPGINVKEGEYLLEVDGRPLTTDQNLYSVFEGTAGRQIKIRVNDKPSMDGSRLITVVPVNSERELRIRNWVEAIEKKWLSFQVANWRMYMCQTLPVLVMNISTDIIFRRWIKREQSLMKEVTREDPLQIT